MKRLYIFRHATAIDKAGPMDDFDRPLTDEGREESKLVGAYMKKKGIEIDCALCSPSVRTRETWDFAVSKFGGKADVFYPERLYTDGEDAIYDEVSAASEQCNSIIIVGHNPGLEYFARSLADPNRSKPKALLRLMANFPKAVFVRFKLDIDRWDDIRAGIGRLTLFRTPSDLRD